MTLTNTGSDRINNLCYTRNVDPDQTQPWNTDFTTDNFIYYNPHVPDLNDNPYGFAAVVSRGWDKFESLVQVLLTRDSRARAAYDIFGYSFDATPHIAGRNTVCGVWYALLKLSLYILRRATLPSLIIS